MQGTQIKDSKGRTVVLNGKSARRQPLDDLTILQRAASGDYVTRADLGNPSPAALKRLTQKQLLRTAGVVVSGGRGRPATAYEVTAKGRRRVKTAA